jgi:DNA-binding NarL/FixJ family response regulator
LSKLTGGKPDFNRYNPNAHNACPRSEPELQLTRQPTHRAKILLVDDFEPWRRFVASMLQQNPQWQIIGEASDGLEAIQKAEELRPDLILLDLGLPKLNGIEAARQIRNVAPESKIIFLSQESSADIVQEALSVGAQGYVMKTKARSDLPAAVEAVLDGGRFVSSGLITSGPG